MRVLCIMGESGVGKTHIANLLDRGGNFNLIKSYTTRKPRGTTDEDGNFIIDDSESDHIFVGAGAVDDIFSNYDVAASTTINGNEYWSNVSQFKEDKINLYVVDPVGYEDLCYLGWDCRICMVSNDKSVRENKVHIPMGIEQRVDFQFNNNKHKDTFKQIACLIEELKKWEWL